MVTTTLTPTSADEQTRLRPAELRPSSPPARQWPVWLALPILLIGLLVAGLVLVLRANEPAPTSTHDSGIEMIVRERADGVASAHDSGIESVLRGRAESVPSAHDSGIEALLRERTS